MDGETDAAVPRIVIVGGGFGGIAAARALRHARARVTVIDRNNYHLFQPLLYQVATAGLSPADISQPIRAILHRQRNAEVLLAEVVGIDSVSRTVQVRDENAGAEHAIPYDYLILATGATHSYFGHDDWAALAPGLKTIPDATEIRRRILLAFEAAETAMVTSPEDMPTLLTFVIVGGGPTGVELAGAIAEIAHGTLRGDFRHIDPASARIVLVEAMPHILAAYPEALVKKAAAKLKALGVEVRAGVRVEMVDADGVLVEGERLAAHNVIWAAGVHGSPAGEWLGAERDRAGRVLVQSDTSVPGLPEVFVVGDTANFHEHGAPLPGVAQVALQQGHFAAGLVAERIAGRAGQGVFHYRDKGALATVGRTFAIASIGRFALSGFAAWVVWLCIHIFFLIGFRNRVLVLFQWAWAYATYQRGARLIVSQAIAVSQPAPVPPASVPPAREPR